VFFDYVPGLGRIGSDVIKTWPFAGVFAPDVLEIVPIKIMNGSERVENRVNIVMNGRSLAGSQFPYILPVHVFVIVDTEQSEECSHVIYGTDETFNALRGKLLIRMSYD
jgi:hypothetical protein